jgi:hypothetical protein
MVKKYYKLIGIRPRVFKFEEGKIWDGDEEIINYLEDILLDDNSKIKQKTYITIQGAKAVKKEKRKA